MIVDPPTGSIGLASTGGDSWETRIRGRLEFETRSETEFGLLTSKLRLRSERKSQHSGDAATTVDQAYIEIAHLFAGYSNSAWVSTTNDGDTGFGGFGIFDGAYGDQQRNTLQFHLNDLADDSSFLAVSVEDDGDMTSWTPDIVARFGTKAGANQLFGVVGYDQDNGIGSAIWNALGGAVPGAGTDEIGIKLGLHSDIGTSGELRLQGFYATGNTAYAAELDYLGQLWTPQWSVLAGYAHTHSAEVDAYISGQYFADIYTPTNTDSGMRAWSVSGGIEWNPLANDDNDDFQVTLEGKYVNVDTNGYFSAFGTLRSDIWEVAMQVLHEFRSV